MSDDQPWYREPETFIALAALVVSISAVVVGIYETSLQREHDRAEVWPHIELETFVAGDGASLYLENTGIGPAVVQSVTVTVDGRPRRNWGDVVSALDGAPIQSVVEESVAGHGVRAGDRVTILSFDKTNRPAPFWPSVARVMVAVCYRSVFDERWLLTAHLGVHTAWREVSTCPAQPDSTDF